MSSSLPTPVAMRLEGKWEHVNSFVSGFYEDMEILKNIFPSNDVNVKLEVTPIPLIYKDVQEIHLF